MIFDPEYISNFALILTSFGGAFLAALWLSLVIWTYRDIKSRARDTLVYILATLVVALLSLPGLLIYLVLRPQLTLEEEYQKTLEEEALLQAIEDQPVCPGCERRIEFNWIVCPNCTTKLKKPCHSCGKLMDLPWNICPFCATPEFGLKKENVIASGISDEKSMTKNPEIDSDDISFKESGPDEVNLEDQDNLSFEP
jgi:hypothetical protein